MSDIEFINGLIAKAPRNGAPDFVKASLSIKREDLVDWLNDQGGEWINADIKESKNGKWYVAVNAWKPEGGNQDRTQRQERSAPAQDDRFVDDDLPF